MWFFDTVLEEKPTTVTQAPVKSNSSSSQDGSFLIIDDTITTERIPDTAVKLFDETPDILMETISETKETVVATDSPVFFDETPVITESELIQENEITPETNDSLTDFLGSDEMIIAEAPVEAPAVNDTLSDFVFAEEIKKDSNKSGQKGDPNAILLNAIEELDALLVGHQELAAAKDSEIESQNNRIAEAKAVAKKALDERKKIETEISRVKQMQELFSSQLPK